jgi:hypothetical protein
MPELFPRDKLVEIQGQCQLARIEIEEIQRRRRLAEVETLLEEVLALCQEAKQGELGLSA